MMWLLACSLVGYVVNDVVVGMLIGEICCSLCGCWHAHWWNLLFMLWLLACSLVGYAVHDVVVGMLIGGMCCS